MAEGETQFFSSGVLLSKYPWVQIFPDQNHHWVHMVGSTSSISTGASCLSHFDLKFLLPSQGL